jgi:hypothetical protein
MLSERDMKIYPDLAWLARQKKITILLLAIFGIVVFILSVIYQDIIYAIIRGFIFLIACLIFYFKSDSLIGYRIQIQHDGKIIIKVGLLKRLIPYTDIRNIHLEKQGNYWLIGEKRIKVPVAAYPDLDKKFEVIKTKN